MCSQPRRLMDIATEIRLRWKPVHPWAEPYVKAMLQLNTIHDKYYFDTAYEIVAKFLGNAKTWRGDDAKRIKLELNNILKSY